MDIMPNDLKRQYDLFAGEYERKAVEALRSGWYVLGREVEAFEREFAEKIGSRHCVGLASGLDALWMAFRLLGVGAGDEVIVSANAYIACVMGITINGATPVFVEPDEYDNIDADKIEAAITPRTAAILAVHLFGQACDMDKICEIASRRGLLLVEDCAQSHLTTWRGRNTGVFGDAACFSFYPTKNLGAFGDGGAITTDSAALNDAFRVFRNYGSREKYRCEVVGANSRLDELQAALLRVKLAHLEELNAERERIAARYLSEVSNPLIALPRVRPGSGMTWHQFVIHSKRRDALAAFLKKRGIGTLIHYPEPPHLSEAYAYLGYGEGDFPIAERAAKEVLSLPMFNGMTDEELSYVIAALNDFGGVE